MRYSCSVFAVKDISATRAFYAELFGLKLVSDYGRNIAFENGLAFQQDFDWLTGVPVQDIIPCPKNCELCFETESFGHFVTKLKARQDISMLHDVLTHSWGQHVIRFYDPDGHIIEVGESMKSVVDRFLSQGKTIAEIAKIMDVTDSDVNLMLSE